MVTLASLGMWAVVACSGETSPETLDSSGFVAQLCQLYRPCCERESLATDVRPCRDSYAKIAAVSDIDLAEANACLAERRARSNDPDFCLQQLDSAESCTRVFRRKPSPDGLALGARCTSDNDCAPAEGGTVRCARTDPVGKEICQLQIDGHAGDGPCLGTVDVSGFVGQPGFYGAERAYLCHLSDGLYCTATSTCAEAKGVGQPCDGPPWVCTSGNFCEYTTKTCMALLGEGSSCAQNLFACARGLSCNRGTCSAERAFGAPCTSGDDCGSKRCVDGTCASFAGQAYFCGD
ncbi:hypothetical protein AKJ09_10353 [Labilithrix luteola]|uniref:Dickkopf N-terminal cysteine-rich domain-containing protein n=1 Tax=Labilithrix luteola TaxID=1391654 RepID=A0A0K1QE36_9BACT|nr:hypothetical protein AKJ09_10353 [Labilithrix luteola]